MCKYKSVLSIAKCLEPLFGICEEQDKLLTFTLGNTIFGAPNVVTGLSTEAAQYMKKPGLGHSTTWEHIYGRKNSALAIIKGIRKGYSDTRLHRLIRSRCRVTISTKDENQKLKAFQQDIDTYSHPRLAYEAAGLKWVRHVGDKVYNIDGTVYYTREDIMEDHGLTSSQLTYRLGSQSKKWKGWTIERIG